MASTKKYDWLLAIGGVAAIGLGAYIWYTDPQIVDRLLGKQTVSQTVQPSENLESEEMEAIQRGLNPWGSDGSPVAIGSDSGVPGGYGSSPFPQTQRIGGGASTTGTTGQVTGPFGVRYPVASGSGVGGFTPSARCNFDPRSMPQATIETAQQMVRILDFPVTPITNTVPRLTQCFYKEIANFVNAGPNNNVYFAVEQVACAISSGAPFQVRNAASLRAAQVAKRFINQGNCYNATLAPVPKRFTPVGVLESARARALRARKASMMAQYSYYAHGGH